MSSRIRGAVKLGLFIFGVYTVFGMFLTGYRAFSVLAEGDTLTHVELLGKAVEELSAAYGLGLLFPVVLFLVRRYPMVPGAAVRRLPGYVAMVAGFAVLHTSFMGKSREILFPILGLGAYDYGIKSLRFPMEFFFQAIHFVTVVGFIHFFLYYQRTRDREVRAARLETQLQRARLENLQAQLHPHFLFNTLNAISSLMYHDVGAADRLMTRLSDLLRMTFARSRGPETTLQEELAWLDAYLSIMQGRFGERLRIRRDVAEDARLLLVPTLLLQPLVENAICHGVGSRGTGGTVEVVARRDGTMLRIEVRDDGPGLPRDHAVEARGNGLGLSNTAARLEQMFGGAHRFDLTSGPEGGTTVLIEIPARMGAESDTMSGGE